jgi:hypothetical protein
LPHLDLPLIPAAATIPMSKHEGCTRLLLDSGAKSAIFLTPLFFGGIVADKFVISSEPFVEKCRSLARAKKLYVDVENGQIRLAWATNSEDASAKKAE